MSIEMLKVIWFALLGVIGVVILVIGASGAYDSKKI